MTLIKPIRDKGMIDKIDHRSSSSSHEKVITVGGGNHILDEPQTDQEVTSDTSTVNETIKQYLNEKKIKFAIFYHY